MVEARPVAGGEAVAVKAARVVGADGPRSVIFRQVSNGLAVRMAALYLCVTAEERGVTAM